jgi:hypothetical protein
MKVQAQTHQIKANLQKKIVPSAQKEEEGRRACPRSSRSRETLCRNTEEMDAKAVQKQARGRMSQRAVREQSVHKN